MLGVVRTALRGAQRGVMSSKRGNVGYYKGSTYEVNGVFFLFFMTEYAL